MEELKKSSQNRRKRREKDISKLTEPGRAREAGWVQKVGVGSQSEREAKTICKKKLDFLAGEANGSR